MKINRQSKLSYCIDILESLFWLIPIVFLFFYSSVCRSYYVPQLKLYISRIYFFYIIDIFVIIWVAFNPFANYAVTSRQIFLVNFLPIEIVSLIIFAQYNFVLSVILLILCVGVNIIFYILIKLASKDVADTRIKRRMERYRLRFIFKSCSAILLVAFIGCLFVSFGEKSIVESQIQKSPSQSLLQDNIEDILKLDESVWYNLSTQDKLNILQIIADIEAEFLSIDSVKLHGAKLDEYTLGEYLYPAKKIYIDIDYLETASPERCIRTICHEIRHAYQHYTISIIDWSDPNTRSALFYKEAFEWKENFENYNSGKLDYYTYYNQAVEVDARNYSEISYYFYYDILNQET